MPTFFDLPKSLRERIYRLHLVREEPITSDDHDNITQQPNWTKKRPPILAVSAKADKEAAPIYFSENTFKLILNGELYEFLQTSWPRYMKLVRNLVLVWDHESNWGCMNERFKVIPRFKSLTSLRLEVDEQKWLERYIRSDLYGSGEMRWHESLGLSLNMQHKALFMPGMNGLRAIRGIRGITFPHSLKGGVFDLVVKPEIHGLVRNCSGYKRKGTFRILDLPSELRNQIYHELLSFSGVVYPSNRAPSSVAAMARYHREADRDRILAAAPSSALDLLAVNRQMCDEAVGIFYWNNDFVFSWPCELQGFLASIGPERMKYVRNITLFHKDHREGVTHTADITLQMLRLLPNLRKFHLLVREALLRCANGSPGTLSYEGNPGQIHGVSNLFSMRKLQDVRVRDLHMEDKSETKTTAPTSAYESSIAVIAKRQSAVLRHFNHGLALAQRGSVNQKLFKEKNWHHPHGAKPYPVLEGSTCSYETGCNCPEGMPYGVQEVKEVAEKKDQ